MRPHHPSRTAAVLPTAPGRGFTLVELVVVIAVLAIVAAIGMTRFASQAPFAARAASDQLASVLRSAHRIAVAQRATVHVLVDAHPARVRLCRDLACTQPITPADGSAQWYTAPDGTRLNASAQYAIDGFGRPSISTALDLRPTDDSGSVQGPIVRIEPETGLVHLPAS
jgi:prepilin-type N-terminal cleavage/methylation domain-containing protein